MTPLYSYFFKYEIHHTIANISHVVLVKRVCALACFQDWSNLDVLLVKSRSTRLQDLQLLTEIQEFIQFMIHPGKIYYSAPVSALSHIAHAFPANFESVNPVYCLLSKWESRFPHPKLDPLSVWDDIVTSR